MTNRVLIALVAIIFLCLLMPQAQMVYTVEAVEVEPQCYSIKVYGQQPFRRARNQCVLHGTANDLALQKIDELVTVHGKARGMVIVTSLITIDGHTACVPTEILVLFGEGPLPPNAELFN